MNLPGRNRRQPARAPARNPLATVSMERGQRFRLCFVDIQESVEPESPHGFSDTVRHAAHLELSPLGTYPSTEEEKLGKDQAPDFCNTAELKENTWVFRKCCELPCQLVGRFLTPELLLAEGSYLDVSGRARCDSG